MFADIDSLVSGSGNYIEAVTVDTPGYTVLYQGSTLIQSGATFAQTYGTNAPANNLSTSERGNLTVQWPGPVCSVTFRYCNVRDDGGSNSGFSTDLWPITFTECFAPTSCP
ncbi:MAG: hypothetical protein ACK5LS_04100 [Propioniciclava sp.]